MQLSVFLLFQSQRDTLWSNALKFLIALPQDILLNDGKWSKNLSFITEKKKF